MQIENMESTAVLCRKQANRYEKDFFFIEKEVMIILGFLVQEKELFWTEWTIRFARLIFL